MIWLKHSPIRRAIIFAYYIMIFINRKVVRNVPEWRNGRRERLKTACLKGRAGSSPASGTNSVQKLVS